MGLVDYSSSDNDNDSDTPIDDQPSQPPPAKKPRTSATRDSTTSITTTTTTNLPPLPSSFHNLYATTVRPFTADLPSLHQGRKRLTPHMEGNWPSHIYIEWHPPPTHHEALSSLLDALKTDLQPLLLLNPTPGHHELTTFLTSDLGAPLPLHISLSRPFVLRTEQKDAFRDTLARCIASVAVAPFELQFVAGGGGLAWFRSAEASRSFLVLRVRTAVQEEQKQEQEQQQRRSNLQLAALLEGCNEVVAAQGQPRLYAAQAGGGDVMGVEEIDGSGEAGGGVQPVDDDGTEGEGQGVDGAFHVSIAWSFAEPTMEIRARTAAVVLREEKKRLKGVLGGIRIPVDSVKVKIGNVVNDIPLVERGSTGPGKRRGLFGI